VTVVRDAMKQDLIWDHFQNEGVAAFDGAKPRLEFLVRRLCRGERVLNIGVGSGYFEHIAKKSEIDVWSLDPSDRAIDNIRTVLGLGDHAQVGYGEDMPFPDGHFDTVIMSEVIEHLEAETCERSLGEVHRVLKLGGKFIGTVPARERLQDSVVICPCCNHRFHRWGHQRTFDIAAMRALLQRRFSPEIVEERFFNDWHSTTWSRRVAGLIKKLLSKCEIGTYGTARSIFFVALKSA